MPNTKSAKKALIQSRKRRIVNLKQKTKIKALVKRALALAQNSKIEDLKKLLPTVYKTIDKGVKSGIFKKNTASRRKSMIAKKTTVRDPANNKETVSKSSRGAESAEQGSNQ